MVSKDASPTPGQDMECSISDGISIGHSIMSEASGSSSSDVTSIGSWGCHQEAPRDDSSTDDLLISQVGNFPDFSCSTRSLDMRLTLLHIGDDTEELRLEDFVIRTAPRYIAVNHVLGDALAGAQMTEGGRLSSQRLLHRRELPVLFQDAISLTRRMDCDHIWIDSVCFSYGPDDDKVDQIAQMDEVYRCAVVTLIGNTPSWRPGSRWVERGRTHQEVMMCRRTISFGQSSAAYDSGQIEELEALVPSLKRWLRDRGDTWTPLDHTLVSKSQRDSLSQFQVVFKQWPRTSVDLGPLLASLEQGSNSSSQKYGVESYQPWEIPSWVPDWTWTSHLDDLRQSYHEDKITLTTLTRHLQLVHRSTVPECLSSPQKAKEVLRRMGWVSWDAGEAWFTASEALEILARIARCDANRNRPPSSCIITGGKFEYHNGQLTWPLSINRGRSSAIEVDIREDFTQTPQSAKKASGHGRGVGNQTNDRKRALNSTASGQKSGKRICLNGLDQPGADTGLLVNSRESKVQLPRLFRCPYCAAADGNVHRKCAKASAPKVYRLVEYHLKEFHNWDKNWRTIPNNRGDSQEDKWYRLFLKANPDWPEGTPLPKPYFYPSHNEGLDPKHARDYPEPLWDPREVQAEVAAVALAAAEQFDENIDPELRDGQETEVDQPSPALSRASLEFDHRERELPLIDSAAVAVPSPVHVSDAEDREDHDEPLVDGDEAIRFRERAPSMSSSPPSSPKLSKGEDAVLSEESEDSSTLIASQEPADRPVPLDGYKICFCKDAENELNPHYFCTGKALCTCCHAPKANSDEGIDLFARWRRGEITLDLPGVMIAKIKDPSSKQDDGGVLPDGGVCAETKAAA